MSDITHRQLEIFRAIMISGSVTAAASLLHTSQPTVSRELARLEQLLAYRLFERARGRLQPTARAMVLFEEVQRSFISLSRVADVATSLGRAGQGELQIVCLPAFAHALLPVLCRMLAASVPDVRVSVTPQESPLLDEWLSAQRFDIGLTEHTEAPPGCRLLALPALAEVCVLPAGHPLLAKTLISFADLAGVPFVSLSPDDPYRVQLDRLCDDAGVRRKLQWETHSAASVCAMVMEGLGIGIVNPLTAKAMAGPSLHVRPLEAVIPYRPGLVLPEYRPASALVSDFVAMVFRYMSAFASGQSDCHKE